MGGQDLIFLALGLLGGWSLRYWIKPSQPYGDLPTEQSIPKPSPSPHPAKQPILPPDDQTAPVSPPTLIDSSSSSEPQTMAQAYQRLRTVERFKSSFLARSAHELRSPINSLIGLHQLILEDLCETPEEEREFVSQAKDAALKILSLLDILIAAAKLDCGREPVQLYTISVVEVFQRVQKLTYLQAANHNLRYEVTLPEPEMTVLSDSQWLSVVLVNLIEDAISNTDLGTIRLWASPNQDPQKIDLCLQTERPLSDLQANLQDRPYTTAIDITNLENLRLSTSLSLAVAQIMLSTLKGELTLEAVEGDGEKSLIRFTLPTG